MLFVNGRVEEFLHCKTLSPQEMCSPTFVPRIAQLVRKFHEAKVNITRKPTLWDVIHRWLHMARKLQFKDTHQQAAYEAIDFKAWEQEIHETEAACALGHSPIVFGHNDLLSGNFLVLQAPDTHPDDADLNGPLTLIDFEYGAYTYRGFDIGNHFNEYAGFECDYTRCVLIESVVVSVSHSCVGQ